MARLTGVRVVKVLTATGWTDPVPAAALTGSNGQDQPAGSAGQLQGAAAVPAALGEDVDVGAAAAGTQAALQQVVGAASAEQAETGSVARGGVLGHARHPDSLPPRDRNLM
jgi:hypothetical protein